MSDSLPSSVRLKQPFPFSAGAPGFCLAILLPLELLCFLLYFDWPALAAMGRWCEEVLQRGYRSPLLFVILAAMFLFRHYRCREDGRRAGNEHSFYAAWAFLAAHLAAFVCLFWLTKSLLLGVAGKSSFHLLLLMWAGLIGAMLLLGFATLSPARFLPSWLWRGFLTLGLGGAVGISAYALGRLTIPLWEPLGSCTFWLVHTLLGLLTRDRIGIPQENIIGTSTFAVRIESACSGYQGIGLIVAFFSTYLWIARKELRFPAALLLLPIGIICIWLVNGVRLTALIAVGNWWSPDIALGGFHSQAGWLAFNAVALGSIVITGRMRFFHKRAEEAATANPAAPYLLPLLVLLAASMMSRAFTNSFDWAYPVRVVTTGAALWYFRRSYRDLGWSWSWTALGGGLLVYLLWIALVPSSPAETAAFASALSSVPLPWTIFWIVLRTLGSVVIAPLAEELAFRGYLTRRLISADIEEVSLGTFSWFSFLISSVIFGLLHNSWLAGTLAGALYAFLYYRRHRLADAVLAHATTNILLTAHVLLSGNWSLWS